MRKSGQELSAYIDSLQEGAADLERFRLWQKVWSEIWEEGFIRGWRQGLLEGKREILLSLGERALGRAEPSVVAKINAIDRGETLLDLCFRVFSASSWNELFPGSEDDLKYLT